jgi:hypothetical protein
MYVVFPQTKLLYVLSPCKHTKSLGCWRKKTTRCFQNPVNHNAENFNILRNCKPNIEKQNLREKDHEPALFLCSVDKSPHCCIHYNRGYTKYIPFAIYPTADHPLCQKKQWSFTSYHGRTERNNVFILHHVLRNMKEKMVFQKNSMSIGG